MRLTDECDIITVGPMEKTTAWALLGKKLGQSNTTKDMQNLAAALDHIPLAIAQAGAYIKRRGSDCSVESYLAKIEKSGKSRTRLLKSASKELQKELRRDEEAQDSIILTWQVSFDHVRATRPSAADLLSLMSMYNYQGIPKYLLWTRGSDTRPDTELASVSGSVERDGDASSSASDDEDSEEDEFEDDVLTLKDFHFISTTSSDTAFEMHRLVQLAAREWLHSHELYQEWAQKSVERLNEALPYGRYENREWCGELYPHVQSTLSLQFDGREASLQRASIQHKAARYNWARGLYSEAEALVAKTYRTRVTMLGLEDDQTLEALNLYGMTMSKQGNHRAAEEHLRRALGGLEKVLGKEHPDTLWSVESLGGVLQYQGYCKAAEECHRRALEGREKVLGKEHPNTLQSVSNLGAVLLSQRQYKAAEEHLRRALEGHEKVLGKEHPDTLHCIWCLADLMKRLDRTAEALLLYGRAASGFNAALGSEHPYTVGCKRQLRQLQQRPSDVQELHSIHSLDMWGRFRNFFHSK